MESPFSTTINMSWTHGDVLALRTGIMAANLGDTLTFRMIAKVPANRMIGPEAAASDLPQAEFMIKI
jgi:hypothetical protein